MHLLSIEILLLDTKLFGNGSHFSKWGQLRNAHCQLYSGPCIIIKVLAAQIEVQPISAYDA